MGSQQACWRAGNAEAGVPEGAVVATLFLDLKELTELGVEWNAF